MAKIFNKPGVPLLIVGAVLAFFIRPIVRNVWLVGGVLSPLALGIGVISIIGGLYLIARSNLGPGGS